MTDRELLELASEGNTTLFGFFHTTCIYESAATLVSLHHTKAGAWKAMHKHQWDEWEKARSPENTNLHMPGYTGKRLRDPRARMRFTRSHIAGVEVLP